MLAQACAHGEVPQQPADGQDAQQRDDGHLVHGYVEFDAGERGALAGLACFRRSDGTLQAADHGFDQFDQRPDSGHGDGAGAHEAHVMAPGALGYVRGCAGGRVQSAEERHTPGPADERAHEHGDAHGDAHQVADTEEREGEREVEARGGGFLVVAETEEAHHVTAEETHLHHGEEQG